MHLNDYKGNVYRFQQIITANHGDQLVSIIGVNQQQDRLVVGGYRNDKLVPASEVTIPDDQRAAFAHCLERAKRVIGGPQSRGSV